MTPLVIIIIFMSLIKMKNTSKFHARTAFDSHFLYMTHVLCDVLSLAVILTEKNTAWQRVVQGYSRDARSVDLIFRET